MNASWNETLHDVVVVGYGPTGMVAAALLGRAGHSVAVVERHAELFHGPRAAVFDDETMRLLQKLGVAELVAEGTIAYPRYEWLNGAGQVLLELQYDNPGRSGWAELYMMYQPHLERVLDGLCRSLPMVSVRQRTLAHAIEQDHSTVRVACRDASGSEVAVRGRYLVAADGGSSFVRRALGIDVSDYGFEENWLVCDFKETSGLDIPYFRQLCDPEQPTAIVRIGPEHHRFSFMLDKDESPERATDHHEVWRRLRRWATPGDMELIRVANYTFRSRVAMRWQTGRIFLAGDAAHQMPPFLGQGMCSGIRDAHNLAWKLDLVLRGRTSSALLDGYQLEREPHVRVITEKGIELGRIQTMRDPVAARRRDEQYLARRAQRKQPDRPPLPSYTSGLLSASSEAAGQLFVQGRVTAGDGAPTLFDDRVGDGFALVVADGDALRGLDAHQLSWWGELPGRIAVLDRSSKGGPDGTAVLDDVDGVYTRWFTEHGCRAALVRPDWYVFGAADGPESTARMVSELEAAL